MLGSVTGGFLGGFMKRMSRAQPGFAAWIMPCELEKLRGGGPLVL